MIFMGHNGGFFQRIYGATSFTAVCPILYML